MENWRETYWFASCTIITVCFYLHFPPHKSTKHWSRSWFLFLLWIPSLVYFVAAPGERIICNKIIDLQYFEQASMSMLIFLEKGGRRVIWQGMVLLLRGGESVCVRWMCSKKSSKIKQMQVWTSGYSILSNWRLHYVQTRREAVQRRRFIGTFFGTF